MDGAVGHAKTREQFGRPIGSFQAIKHKLADAFVRRLVAAYGDTERFRRAIADRFIASVLGDCKAGGRAAGPPS